jgi:hypothetical protein
MNSILGWLVAQGYGKDFLTNILRKLLTGGSAALCAYLAQHGVEPDTFAGLSTWMVSLAPIVVAIVWEILEKRFAAQVTTAALVAPPGTTMTEVKTDAIARLKAGTA